MKPEVHLLNKHSRMLLVKPLVIVLMLSLSAWLTSATAQKFAFVDTEYILKRIPAYEAAQDQITQASKKWQSEVEAAFQGVSALYKAFQTENVFLSAEMKAKRENEIVEKEKQAKQLQQRYFGPEGELFKRREALIKPIQDDIYSAISAIATEKGYAAIFDKASNVGVIFSDPKIDISDDVLKQLGIIQ
jgi:outer membrane protein